MNQGRIWCVVSPNVGLPLLLGSVAVTSLIVHASVMTHTTWMSAYWSGSWRNKTAMIDSPAPKVASATLPGAPAFAVTVTPVPGVPGKTETSFVVSVTPNPSAPTIAAAASEPAPRTPGALAPGALALAAPTTK
jgi:light-harvesting protein B-800-850 alpha chain